ncbi:hypothetical protein [Desulfococcus multivorans]|uniref:Nudix hydrolase domain-containing protein n=1 Tax=Desulfococcus multivorans DSM 2059 TaxID=1121405 RepID=S7UHH7_DESML|nr:hypothetical protein [Desulfococcus multivorans]AOY59351.1 conserved uncharacterized protein [Desulfococcus multivorans]AQV01566.1 hypothetical protein B2D07_12910 [Desulfococcus multivorans]EPR33304.1 hypothetical protein dsmv_0843 [Desulfococcus multivorans DSM 2059]SKA14025.1 Predicted phosphoesterase, NUDIX family [Desulfococcus multivorans DSM 2059]
MTEQILCVERTALPPNWTGETAVVPMGFEDFLSAVRGVRPHWLPRPEAELNPAYKQLIPYVVLRADNSRKIACYRRRGSETRLHALWSCGIGGHINPVDAADTACSFGVAITHGVNRELDEELPRRPGDAVPRFKGVINEERTEVGTVHLGLVYSLAVPSADLCRPGRELNNFSWMSAPQAARLNLELWSRLAMALL